MLAKTDTETKIDRLVKEAEKNGMSREILAGLTRNEAKALCLRLFINGEITEITKKIFKTSQRQS